MTGRKCEKKPALETLERNMGPSYKVENLCTGGCKHSETANVLTAFFLAGLLSMGLFHKHYVRTLLTK